jgi:integrase
VQLDQRNPHRTDAKRGKRERLAPGIYRRQNDPDPTRFLIFWSVDGAECSAVFHGTLAQAKKERERKRVKSDAGELVAPNRLRFSNVWSEYESMFESLVATGEASQRTLDLYRQRYRTHLEKPLGNRRIQEVQAKHLSDLLSTLRSRGLSSWTIRGVLTLAGSILNHAFTRGYRVDNPIHRLSKTEKPKAKNKTKARVLDVDAITALIANTIPSYFALIVTAVYTGMRQSELLGLRWRDVDFDAGKLRVRHQLSRARKSDPARLLPLKSDAGERDLDLMPDLAKVLREHKLASGYSGDNDFVFSTLTGNPVYYRNASARGLQKAADRAGLNPEGLPRLSFHDLRHTAITHLIRSGADVAQVQRFAGHAKPSITLDVYVHEFEARKSNDVGERLSAAFGGVL